MPRAARAADEAARARGRVAVLDAERPDGLEGGWTPTARQRRHVLDAVDRPQKIMRWRPDEG